MSLSDDDLWLLSYYRSSEINGSLFFGRMARALRPGPIQHDLTKHFADEAQHAWYWTRCITELGGSPLKLDEAYQDRYLEACGLPANLMEVLAITLVFERRVINQYAKYLGAEGIHPAVGDTIRLIMEDERWHVRWVRDALTGLESRFGADNVAATLARFTHADQEVFRQVVSEHGERVAFLRRFEEDHP